MTHATALTEHAVGMLDGRDKAKRLSVMVACSYRTIEQWIAHRRAMCLDNAVELAARNDEFRAALMARIEQVRVENAIAVDQNMAAASGEDVAPAFGQVERRSRVDRRISGDRRASSSTDARQAFSFAGTV